MQGTHRLNRQSLISDHVDHGRGRMQVRVVTEGGAIRFRPGPGKCVVSVQMLEKWEPIRRRVPKCSQGTRQWAKVTPF